MTTEALKHVRGTSRFIGDAPLPVGTLHARVFTSQLASAILEAVDVGEALAVPGVVAVFTAQDIPGRNQIGDIIADESLLAFHHIRFVGKPIALVLAETPHAAATALEKIHCVVRALPAELSGQHAAHSGETFGPARTLQKGDPDAQWHHCSVLVDGSTSTGAQEHLYFETQRCLAIPHEGDRLQVFSATQSPSACQHAIADVLGIDMHQVEVEVERLGGAFGGKEEQAKTWAVLAALGAHLTQRPVWLALSREEDFHYTGKRHPYTANYRLGLDDQGRILAYEVEFFQDGGAVADLSTAILERTLFHATGACAIPHARIRATSCRTNKPSNTAFRGFGAPQGYFTLMAALAHAAEVSGIPFDSLQQRNLATRGHVFPYGQALADDRVGETVATLFRRYDIDQRRADITAFNQQSRRYKRGAALTPICFGIAFTSTSLNQASATLHIYRDGSIDLHCAAVEMGQGVYRKVRQAAANVLGVDVSRIRIESTTTRAIANMSPTAASTGSDINGMAAMAAAQSLRQRLLEVAAKHLGCTQEQAKISDDAAPADKNHHRIGWQTLVEMAWLQRVSLSAHAHHATPGLGYDRSSENGHPFAYHAYGATWVEACVDTLTGRYSIEKAFCVYDIGQSLAPDTDRGQIEGAFVQGMGLCTSEEICWNDAGELLTFSLATYKIPDLASTPAITVDLLDGGPNAWGPGNSKAVGEPPLIGGLGCYFALRDALKAHAPALQLPFAIPLTPEKVLMALIASETPA